ncbi:MAG: methyltransferase domain-containing protein [Alphaproteobacteria bacterium]|nr:methyltransferase domain-containing protein [Alphaproteobacteria bacterium]
MTQTPSPAANAAQIDYWNATAGRIWAQFQEHLDRQIAPLGLEALRVLAPRAGERILDVGCGCGQTTLDLAARVGSEGQVTGVDISEPMLAVARARPAPAGAAQPAFLDCDAQTADLGEGVLDAVFSRFGVMFFSDPPTAFANLRKALKPGGRLTFVCWRPYPENPWMRAPMEAAQPFLPPIPPADPTAPGPFAFADPQRVQSILQAAGFEDIRIRPFDAMIGGGSIDETLDLTFRVGPLGAALREAPHLAPTVREAVRARLSDFATAEGVLMPAAVWIVQATR